MDGVGWTEICQEGLLWGLAPDPSQVVHKPSHRGVARMQEATVHLSAHAVRHGLAAALPAEVGILVSGRGERDSPATNDLPITMRLAEPPAPCDWLRSA